MFYKICKKSRNVKKNLSKANTAGKKIKNQYQPE